MPTTIFEQLINFKAQLRDETSILKKRGDKKSLMSLLL